MKTKLNWWEYWIGHCWMTGWQSIKMTFWIWRDLMSDNYDGYALLNNDDPLTECLEWFWASINEDDVYPKDFLEELMQMADDVETGKVKTYSWEEVRKEIEFAGNYEGPLYAPHPDIKRDETNQTDTQS
jgi:hypothetical protein